MDALQFSTAYSKIVFILLALTVPIIASQPSLTSGILQRSVQDRRLNVCGISKMIVTNLMECTHWCMTEGCWSFNYGRGDNNTEELYTCELNSCTKEDRLMLVSPGFDYYEMTVPRCFIDETCTGTPFALYFPVYSSGNYVKIGDKGLQELSAVTICSWTKFHNFLSVVTLLYSVPGSTDELAIMCYQYVALLAVKGNWIGASIPPFHIGSWHALCVTWSSVNGEVSVYLDSGLMVRKTGVNTGQKIIRGGYWMLGQVPHFWKFRQTNHVELTGVNVWGCVVTPKEIAKFSTNCKTCIQGDIIRWQEFKSGVQGNVTIVENPIC